MMHLLHKQWANRNSIFSLLWCWEAKAHGAKVAPDVIFYGRPIIRTRSGSKLELKKAVSIYSGFNMNPLGLPSKTILRTLDSKAELIFDERSGISGGVVCAGNGIYIGKNVAVGAGCLIIDNDFHQWTSGRWANNFVKNARPVVIGNDAFIGTRTIILKGVTIGEGSIIGAGSVVSINIPSGVVAAGNPAKVIKAR